MPSSLAGGGGRRTTPARPERPTDGGRDGPPRRDHRLEAVRTPGQGVGHRHHDLAGEDVRQGPQPWRGAPSHGVAITTRSASAVPACSRRRGAPIGGPASWPFSSWQASRACSSTRSRWRPPRRPRPAGWRAPSRPGRSPEHADADQAPPHFRDSPPRPAWPNACESRGVRRVRHRELVQDGLPHDAFTSSNRSSRAPLRMAVMKLLGRFEPTGSMSGLARGASLRA